MKQIVQPVSGGPVTLLEVPAPVPEPTEVLVRTLSSVISPGTERAVTALAQSSLVAKARARPDLVRQVVKKARVEGIMTARQAVLGRLAGDVALGYSAAGMVIEVGCAVTGIKPGQLVATGGAGKANHAERPYLAIRLDYPGTADPDRPVQVRAAKAPAGADVPGVGLVGAGSFATGTLLPAFASAGLSRLVAVASAGGLTATRAAQRHGFEKAVAGPEAVLTDPDVTVVAIATPHDTHAALTVRALAAGRHVWCEKPLGLTEEELDEVHTAWLDSGRVLAIGFNRRWSPAVAAARQALAVAAAKLVVYRIAAGPVPEGHWYHDPRQGGRLLGEVCRFIDTAQALVGAPIEGVTALSGGGPAGPADDTAVALRFADGSLASIGYGSALPSTGKERIEVHAGGRCVVIDDFRSVTVDGKSLWKGRQDKGHRALAIAFRQAVAGTESLPTEEMIATMRATIRAATRGYGRG